MAAGFPNIYLVRHGETAWSRSGQHTGLTDLPLTELGEQRARELRPRLHAIHFDHVFTSPLQRARRTCELAGYGVAAKIDADLVEWNYGEHEGKRTDEIRAVRPGWNVFHDGCPGGESVAEISARADRMIARLKDLPGDTALLFSSGHLLRVLAARWLKMDAAAGERLTLDTASVSILGYQHNLDDPVIRLWNEVQLDYP